MFDEIVFQKMKPKLIKKMTKFQIGTKPGHRAQEHLFTLKSTMALYSFLGITLIAQAWDISKYFDQQVLVDAMSSINDAKVNENCYILTYKNECKHNR